MLEDGLVSLRLEPAAQCGSWLDGKIERFPESHFLDFVIDGTSLSGRVNDAEAMVTALNRAWMVHVPDAVEVLLGRRPSPDLDAGRVPLLLCAACGDLGCGMLTASLSLGPAEVLWSAFLWEDGIEKPRSVEMLSEAFRFGRAEYEAQMAAAPARVAAMPFDELAHRGKGLLWPWQWGWKLPPKPPS